MVRKNLFTFSADILVLLLMFLLFITAEIMYPIINSNDYMQNHYKRIEIISSTSKKKAVVFGGSSVGFSLNSKLLSSLNNEYFVINYVTNAGLSYNFLLDEILEYLNEGDEIIFSLEYEYFFRDDFNRELYIHTMNLRNRNIQNPIINRYLFRTNKIFSTLVYSIYYNTVDQSSPYKANSINNFGDMVSHYGLESVTFKTNKLEGDFNQNFFAIFYLALEIWKQLE